MSQETEIVAHLLAEGLLDCIRHEKASFPVCKDSCLIYMSEPTRWNIECFVYARQGIHPHSVYLSGLHPDVVKAISTKPENSKRGGVFPIIALPSSINSFVS